MGHSRLEKKHQELLVLGAQLGLSPVETYQFQSALEELFNLIYSIESNTQINQDKKEHT